MKKAECIGNNYSSLRVHQQLLSQFGQGHASSAFLLPTDRKRTGFVSDADVGAVCTHICITNSKCATGAAFVPLRSGSPSWGRLVNHLDDSADGCPVVEPFSGARGHFDAPVRAGSPSHFGIVVIAVGAGTKDAAPGGVVDVDVPIII